jgi:UDP-2,3-diacylglucosamine hydrolase
MPALFISDLHLSPERPDITRACFVFLQHRAAQASALYILGDLFETWIGDDDPAELSVEIQGALRNLTDAGVPLFVQAGNRDFLLGPGFARATGATILADQHIITHYGHRALIMHGDSLCTDDLAYQRFRRYARNPLLQFCFKRLSLVRRQKLAADMRRKSAAANSNKASEIMDVNGEAVAGIMEKHRVTTLIHGHTHRPNRHQVASGERIVLGDWHSLGWVLSLDDAGYDLQSFSIATAEQ